MLIFLNYTPQQKLPLSLKKINACLRALYVPHQMLPLPLKEKKCLCPCIIYASPKTTPLFETALLSPCSLSSPKTIPLLETKCFLSIQFTCDQKPSLSLLEDIAYDSLYNLRCIKKLSLFLEDSGLPA